MQYFLLYDPVVWMQPVLFVLWKKSKAATPHAASTRRGSTAEKENETQKKQQCVYLSWAWVDILGPGSQNAEHHCDPNNHERKQFLFNLIGNWDSSLEAGLEMEGNG